MIFQEKYSSCYILFTDQISNESSSQMRIYQQKSLAWNSYCFSLFLLCFCRCHFKFLDQNCGNSLLCLITIAVYYCQVLTHFRYFFIYTGIKLNRRLRNFNFQVFCFSVTHLANFCKLQQKYLKKKVLCVLITH